MNDNDPSTPCAYALMVPKSPAFYEDIFEALKEEANTLGNRNSHSTLHQDCTRTASSFPIFGVLVFHRIPEVRAKGKRRNLRPAAPVAATTQASPTAQPQYDRCICM